MTGLHAAVPKKSKNLKHDTPTCVPFSSKEHLPYYLTGSSFPFLNQYKFKTLCDPLFTCFLVSLSPDPSTGRFTPNPGN
jgi:hypothetical protein